MRRTVLLLAQFLTLGLLVAGCQKETIPESTTVAIQDNSVRTAWYSVDGVWQTVTLYSDAEFTAFVAQMVDLSTNGSVVKAYCGSAADRTNATKQTYTYSTDSKEKAMAWSEEMLIKGYSVEIALVNGKYICIATN